MIKRILFLMRQTPYATNHAVEALEAILVAGVFEQDVTVLFKDDGVWQLVKDQDGSELGTRTVAKVLQALPEYDVTKLFACATSLAERGLGLDDLAIPVAAISFTEQAALLSEQDAVLND